MQAPAPTKPPVGVVFDSSMGEDIGEALALALIYGLEGKQECRVVGLAVSKTNLESAGFLEILARFYLGPLSPMMAQFIRVPPIGMSETGVLPNMTPMLAKTLSRANEKGEPVYKHDVRKITDTADALAVLRNAFTGQHDGNAVAVLTGPATNFAGVLDLAGAKDLIAKKCRLLVIAEGHLGADIPAAKKLLAEWPTPITAAGSELGKTLRYPGSSIENDFSWSTAPHPIVDAYKAAGEMPYDAPAHAMAGALHAVRTEKPYFKLSDAGTLQVASDGKLTLMPGSGTHRKLEADPDQQEAVIRAFTELASAKPVPRQPRRPPPKKQPAKPPEAKPSDESKPSDAKPASEVKPE